MTTTPAQRFGAGIDGLTAAEAARRKAAGQANATPRTTTRSYTGILIEHAFPAANIALAAVAVALLALGLYIDALFTGGLVVGNIAVGVFQEVRAKRQLDRIAVLARSNATVIRDGAEVQVPAEDVVEGDVALVQAGDQVQVDGTVLAEERCSVDESLLTGESDLIAKRPGDEIFSGSLCMAGRALYRCERVGGEGMANRIAAQARAFNTVRTPLQREVGYALWASAAAVILLAIPVVWSFRQVYGELPLIETTRAAAVIIALVPQGLWVMVTVTYAVAIIRIAPRGTLVQRLNAVESMSHVDTLCLDKTGTITTNTLILEALHPLAADEPALREAFASYCASVSIGNRSTEAIAAALGGAPAPVIDEVQFDSKRKWSALVLDAPGGRAAFVLGAPEIIGRLCVPHDAAPIDGWTGQGLRVLLLARAADAVGFTPADDGEPALPDGMQPLGYAVLRDELRANARETIGGFAEGGIELKVISGDHPATVSALARAAGIPNADRYIAGPDLAQREGADFDTAVAESAVFGRITPDQKAAIVDSLKAGGRYVAMTGDGVNDVPAMKRAHLSIAMRAGTAVTRGIADMILLEDSFAALPAALSEGRRIRTGMATVVRLFLARTITVMLIILGAALASSEFPLTPRHTAIQSVLVVGTPAFFIALWAKPELTGKYLIPSGARFVVPAGLTLAVVGFIVYELALHYSDVETARTILTLVMVFAGVILVTNVENPPEEWMTLRGMMHPRRTAALAAILAAAAVVVAFTPLSSFYELEDLSPLQWLAIAAGTAAWAVLIALTWRIIAALARRREGAAPSP